MELVIMPQKNSIIPWRELWPNRQLLYFFALKDITLRYRYQSITILWVMLQPLIIVLVLSFIFGQIGKPFSNDVPYPLFVFIGLLYWNYFLSSLSRASTSLTSNQSLITRVYFPRLILPASSMAVGLVDFIFSSLILFVMIFFFQKSISFSGVLLFVPLLALTIISSFGLGLFFAAFQVKYRDSRELLPFFTYIIFFLTPVIYPKSLVPESFHQLLYLNPMTGVIETLRETLFTSSVSFNFSGLIISILASIIILILGILYFNKVEREFADII